MPVWTAERIAKLLHLRDTGLSFTEISKKMGITRNAAIGKFQRMDRKLKGLPDYWKTPTTKRSKSKKHIRKKVVNHPRPKPPPPKEFVLTETKKKVEKIVDLPMYPMPAAEKRAMVEALSKLHEKVLHLSRMECNYPIGQVSDPNFTYCFAPVSQYGKSYCDEHCELCFSKPAPRAKRPNYVPGASHYRGQR